MRHDELVVLRLGAALIFTGAVGVMVLNWQRSGDGGFTAGPSLWWIAYGLFVVAVLVDGRLPGRWGAEIWLVLLCLSAVAVYLLAARVALTAVCLATSAAAAAFVLSLRSTIALTVAIGQVAVVRVPLPDVLTTTALFGGVQLSGVLMAATALRKSRTRAELSQVYEELRTAQALLRGSAQVGERLRISRELHDLVGHQLTALALELEVAAHHTDGDAAQHVDRARRTAKTCWQTCVTRSAGYEPPQPKSLRPSVR